MSANLPVIGACLPVEALSGYRDWLLEADRDVELQSFHTAEILDDDWRPLAEEARRQLDGHGGRLSSSCRRRRRRSPAPSSAPATASSWHPWATACA